jgi:hypothetical protein
VAKEMSKSETVKCLECQQDVKLSNGKNHAVTHWGENLKKVSEQNTDAKKRIDVLLGVA